MTVIPDQIEPVEGWKGWSLGTDGKLYSQQGRFRWEPGEHVQAACLAPPIVHRGWHPDREADGSEVDPVTEPPPHPYPIVASSFVTYFQQMPAFEIESIPEPNLVLPYPLRWYYRQQYETHEAPHINCACGIYMADSHEEASRYGDVVGKVAGWGTVVKHGAGCRAQYAYPTELHVSAEQAEKIADYGVPLVLTEEPTQLVREMKHINRAWPWLVSSIALAALALLNLGLVLAFGGWWNAVAAVIAAYSSGMSLRRGLP